MKAVLSFLALYLVAQTSAFSFRALQSSSSVTVINKVQGTPCFALDSGNIRFGTFDGLVIQSVSPLDENTKHLVNYYSVAFSQDDDAQTVICDDSLVSQAYSNVEVTLREATELENFNSDMITEVQIFGRVTRSSWLALTFPPVDAEISTIFSAEVLRLNFSNVNVSVESLNTIISFT